MNNVLLVGCGHMGSALLSAWIELKSYTFSVVDPYNYYKLKKKYNKKKIQFFDKLPNQSLIKKFDIIIFAIKPQIAKQVIDDFHSLEFKKNSVIGTIVAGKKISFYKNNIRNSSQIIRIMPNMPALINQGVSCFVSNKKVSSYNKKRIDVLFKKVGQTVWLKSEIEIDKATAISGSGPGYIFMLIDAFEQASQKIGLSKKISREIILSTILGSTKLMQKSKKEPSDLVNLISVKGGTTEAGIKILKKNNLNKIMHDTFTAAFKKASSLGKK